MMPEGSPVMPGHDFSVAWHFAVMPGEVQVMLRGVFWSPRELFSSPARPNLRPGRFLVMWGVARVPPVPSGRTGGVVLQR